MSLLHQLSNSLRMMYAPTDKATASGQAACACSSSAHRHHAAPQAATVRSSCSAEHLKSCAFRAGPVRVGRLLRTSARRPHLQQQTMRPCAARNPLEEQLKQDSINVNLRSEAEAPWRSLRLVMFTFFCVSATVGAVIATTQVFGALRGAEDALPLNDVSTSLAVDLGAIATFVFLLRRDLKARDKQVARLQREERLGALNLELANKKMLRLSELRGFSRTVIFAGTPDQCRQVVETAEPFREALAERGVLLVVLPVYGSGAADVAPLKETDLRWRASPLRLREWTKWFDQQLSASSKSPEQGLYVGLRMDGRVRASGTGAPPWDKFIRQLAPVEGMWKGFLDGMDGRVN